MVDIARITSGLECRQSLPANAGAELVGGVQEAVPEPPGAGVGYAELAQRLTDKGLPETEGSITVKINRGGFPAWFLIASLEAIGVSSLRLD